MAARPERRSADISWTAASRRSRSRRSVRSPITRRFSTRRRSGCSTICRRFSGCCSPTIAFARWPTRSERARCRCRIPIRRSTSSSSRERSCSSAPAASATAAPDSRPHRRPVVRFHDISSQCPRPVDTATPARFAFAPCPPRLARNARTYEITLAERREDPPHQLRSRSCAADRLRRAACPAQDDWNKFDVPGLRGIRKTAPYFHNNSAATLEEVVDHYIEFFKRVQVNRAAGRRAAGREHRRRALRSASDARGARCAPRVPAKAIATGTTKTQRLEEHTKKKLLVRAVFFVRLRVSSWSR